MRSRYSIIFVLLLLIGITTPSFARNNSDEFGVGLYSIGYYFPLLSNDISFTEGDYEVDNNFEGQEDLIHNIQFTYGVTSHVFFQLSAAYYQGSIDVNREYKRTTEDRSEYIALDGNNDFKITPISLGLGYSFLKEGKFDPYISMGMTFFRVKVDQVDLELDEIIVRDNATGARMLSAENDLRDDFTDMFINGSHDSDLGLFCNLGMNYFFTDNFAVDVEARYYHGTVVLYDYEDEDFNVGGISISTGFKFVF